uniref:DUF6824 domain-containing protein n=1 Tax=Grammatophora oceanica TaxID=210454 RepID=A0A7S1VNW8_9STRA|mmetsp:Transcript_51821/g.77342  ORF Transcript_51821/g.77342 Transcript_51821/m.77342 type:complete len:832 (+) Transcript_51821:253-2748(+)|eukprot:CAMPEP_0194031532 /NCGR_PEP_ID=MMETSP0009_2-20130614/4685_1 /TAXON_ID=210454 /ORGANISM="Grammatophora oceanica, Strain CCMP 410" /LENGTH=831 /DNA_ID=CAMNT_0038671721 /DNA_START=178 /DNA_END=2673 /DNA_ORIENTATION=-
MSRAPEVNGPAAGPPVGAPPHQYGRLYGGGPPPPPPPPSNYRRVDSFDRKNHQQAPENRVPDEEGVEVVLGAEPQQSMTSSTSSGSRSRDQSIFRGGPGTAGSEAVRPRPMRAPMQTSSSYGGGYHAHGGGPYPPPRPPPMQVPFTASGSFDEGYPPPPPPPPPPGPPPSSTHYSPHVHYPQPGQRNSEVNVISPNHKPDPYSRPGPAPMTPRGHAPPQSRGYYQYPPTSPVSRPGGSNQSPSRPSSMRGRGGYRPNPAPSSAYHPDDGTFNAYGPPSDGRPPVVAESSFDSDQHMSASSNSHFSSQPPTPTVHPPSNYESHASQFYGPSGGSWGSFDAMPHFDDYRYYGYPPPESPYSNPHYSPYYSGDNQFSPHGPPSHHPYDRRYEDDEQRMLREGDDGRPPPPPPHHHPSHHPPHGGYPYHHYSPYPPHHHHPYKKEKAENKQKNGLDLPEAAREVDFDIVNPPMEPKCQPSAHPVCESPGLINSNDVLCGRGGGTNSQVGNRRFRKLVQDFQPTYLLARRKEKPLLARSIVLIIRQRGGRFLKKDDDTGELYEVGDEKAEAKTSQALREGLDVRASKANAAAAAGKKPKKKSKAKVTPVKEETETNKEKETEKSKELEKDVEKETKLPEVKKDVVEEPTTKKDEPDQPKADPTKSSATPERSTTPPRSAEAGSDENKPPESPPALPRLAEDKVVHPHSPDVFAYRKRRRMRSGEGCLSMEDKLFPDFCPPRADLARTASPILDMEDDTTPPRKGGVGPSPTPPVGHGGDDGIRVEDPSADDFPDPTGGCAGIAMSIMTGAATGSFCLGPRSKWTGGASAPTTTNKK